MVKFVRTFGIYGDARADIANRRFSGVLQYCAEHKIQVRDFRRVEVVDDFRSIPPSWKRQVDGVILCIGRATDLPERQLSDWVVSGGVPAVSLSSDWTDERIPIVYTDHLELAKLASDHLLEAGCKSFVYYAFDHSRASNTRGNEFQKRLKTAGKKVIHYTGHISFNASFDDEQLALQDQQFIEHLKKLPKPIGVWAINDLTASAICTICRHLELHVPKQVKILGTDDSSAARMQLPMLSSIQTPAKEMGYQAAKILLSMIKGKKPPKVTKLYDAKVIVRDSTTPVIRPAGDIEDVLAYIEAHACDGISVEELPKIMGVSRRMLQDIFLKEVGYTPIQEIHRVRLDRAKTLLRDTQLSISRIAVMVGFEESAAFGKFFRLQTEMTPMQFREQEVTD